MDAVRSGMPLRAISRVIASCGRTTETAESIATWSGWFRVKYFAIWRRRRLLRPQASERNHSQEPPDIRRPVALLARNIPPQGRLLKGPKREGRNSSQE